MNVYLAYAKKYWWISILLLILILFLLIPKKEDVQLEEISIDKTSAAVEEQSDTIKVDVKGFVTNPGLYELEVGSRLNDAINSAGGLLTEADTNTINLSKILSDEMVIIVYSKNEIKNMIEGNTTIKYIDQECHCPIITNDACPEEVVTNLPDVISDSMISINTASIVELDSLPGIGLSKAQDIVDYRLANGPFKVIDDIKNVSGIGDVIFDKIKDLIKI